MTYVAFIRQNWLFLLAGFVLTFTSSYGQTYFISLFAGEIMTDFELSDGAWGGIYTLGTTASALVMVWAGAVMDRFRVRVLSGVLMFALAGSCLAMAWNTSLPLLVLVIFALRLTGQGMMSQLALVAMVRWFEASRGKAISLASMGFSVGQAVLPVIFVALLAVLDWRLLWVVAGATIIFTVPLLVRLLQQERTPQAMAEETQMTGMNGRHWTRPEVIKSRLFLLMLPTMIGPGAWGTALFFQQVHLTEVKGWDLISYVALMPLYTLSTIVATFVSGWAIDRFGVSRIMPFQMVPFAISFAVLAYADTLWLAGVGLVAFGVGQALSSTGSSTFWAEYFGTRHIGTIKSLVTALMVLGSAIGPGVTGLLIDWGITFPQQMIPIAVYYVIAGVLTTIGIAQHKHLIAR
ncbi:MAG: MFS transporter [Pseudomonadota bacterium]